MSKKQIGLGILIGLGIVIFLASVKFIGAGVGMVTFNRFTGGTTQVSSEGITLVNPITTAYKKYDLKIVKAEYNDIEGLSSDSQTIKMNLIVNWRLNPSTLVPVFRTVQGNIKDTILYNAVVDTAKAELGKFKIEEIAVNREALKSVIEATLKERMKANFIDIYNVSIVNIDFNDAFEEAINQKKIAEQQAMEAKNRKEKTKYEAEAKAIENQNMSATITPLVLKQRWIEKWNGILPNVMTGENAATLLQL